MPSLLTSHSRPMKANKRRPDSKSSCEDASVVFRCRVSDHASGRVSGHVSGRVSGRASGLVSGHISDF